MSPSAAEREEEALVAAEEGDVVELDAVSALLAASERARSHIRLLLAQDDEEIEHDEVVARVARPMVKRGDAVNELELVAASVNGLSEEIHEQPPPVSRDLEALAQDDDVMVLLSDPQRDRVIPDYAASEPAPGAGYSADPSVTSAAWLRAEWSARGEVLPRQAPHRENQRQQSSEAFRTRSAAPQSVNEEELDFFFQL